MNENENEIVEISDGKGKNVPFEVIKVIYYNEVNYAILHPLAKFENLADDCCVIFEMQDVDDDTIDLVPVQDDEILEAVYNLYVEWAESEEE